MSRPTTMNRSEFGASLAKELLDLHYRAFREFMSYAEKTGHTVPSDTKSTSEILVSLLTGIPGLVRRKGPDLEDGSDVKAANAWSAIDKPRFNGCAPSGRVSETARRPDDLSAFDDVPHLFLVLWDERPPRGVPRCRVWAVSPRRDEAFREVVGGWYELRRVGKVSRNFQLHPPINDDSNVIRSSFGNLEYPLLFRAEMRSGGFEVMRYEPGELVSGKCAAP